MHDQSTVARCLLLAAIAGSSSLLIAQSPVQSCNTTPRPAWCSAVPGDRSQGWVAQHRSEVMARNGMVTTSQPLAAQAGLDVLKKGGNAIDAAVATAAALTLMEPMNVGPAGDLFAIIDIAKENKLYTLNASGKAPSGQTVARMNSLLHNRGSLFTLDPKSPNAIEPQKRPFNTLSAGFVMKNDRPLMTVTLMGGDMQAQGIAQVLVNVLDLGANLQAATDMARFRHNQVPNALGLESQLFALVGGPLRAMGHTVASINGEVVGGYQAIMFTPDPHAPGAPAGTLQPIKGFYRAGSDHRKDGQAAGY